MPYEADEVSRLIIDSHDQAAFSALPTSPWAIFATGCYPDMADSATLAAVSPGITPEMAAAVSKIMRNQDLVLVARKSRVVTRLRGLRWGWLAGCPRACSPTTRPTMPPALPPACSMACSTPMAMP